MWGSQALLVSARLVRAALGLWDEMGRSQDGRLIAVCRRFGLPLWYTAPCLAEHAPLRSVHNTPPAYAPDFDPDFRLAVGAGFQPPEGVPGWFTPAEGRLLADVSAGRADTSTPHSIGTRTCDRH